MTETKKLKKGMCALLHELSDDEDETVNIGPNVPEDPKRPWLQHFWAFMDAVEQVPDGWSAVKWWRVSAPTKTSPKLIGGNSATPVSKPELPNHC
jgi:hypothetical protein